MAEYVVCIGDDKKVRIMVCGDGQRSYHPYTEVGPAGFGAQLVEKAHQIADALNVSAVEGEDGVVSNEPPGLVDGSLD